MGDHETPQTVLIGGVVYDYSGATEMVQGTIQDVATVQARANEHKVEHDIMMIARQALLDNIEKAIANGDSGLVEIEQEAPTTVAEATDTKEV